jgi:2'-5' RNA ligase
MQRMVRTFIAVELSADVRGRAARLMEKLKQTPAKVRWIESRNLHLTLKFLGDVEAIEIPEVLARVQQAVRELESFDLTFYGVGAFPDASNPRTIWLGAREGSQAMIAMHQRVEDALAEMGFRKENRRFRPHVTIGRVRDTRNAKRDLKDLLAKYADYEGGISHVEELVVFSSQLQEGGPLYEPLGRAELKLAS